MVKKLIFLAFVVTAGLMTVQSAFAQERSYLLAQMDPDEAYDPFSDYSEFEEESDEEADINFFRNGRFLTLGLAAGLRGFTGNFANIYDPSLQFGLYLTYFFDLRIAMALGFQTGDHKVSFNTLTGTGDRNYSGNVSITAINFDLKYYFNTQNVTRGLADLNPYMIAGLGQFYRTHTINGLDGYGRDSAMGFNIGGGLEIPLMQKKAFLGVQGVYHYVDFADESKQFVNGTEQLKSTFSGDFMSFSAIIGLNF